MKFVDLKNSEFVQKKLFRFEQKDIKSIFDV